MKKSTKAILYQLISFGIIFFAFRYIVANYTNLTGLWIPITAAVVATLLAPKFQAIRTPDGEKLFMKWIFIRGIREIK